MENTDTGRLCVVVLLVHTPPGTSVSKLDTDYAIFKEVCTSSTLMMKLLIKSLAGEKYTSTEISIGSAGSRCGCWSDIN